MQEYLGSYRLLQQIRSGKTCQVWEAMHDDRKQKFALKVLPAEFAKDREQIGYLKHEFAVGHPLQHPHVIQSYELGIDRTIHYLAMELCASFNLKQVLQQGVDSLQSRLPAIIEQAAEGLAYLHSKGWVHRDVKPDNFLFLPSGAVKLIDFALAVRPRSGWMKLLPARRTSRIQGTRSYMSPEQIRGLPLDVRADVYSFGCMVHELLSGKPPYTGTSTNDLLMKHLKAAPPGVQSANRNVSDEFARLVKSMMAKQPNNRPRDLSDFLNQFRSMNVFKTPPTSAAPR